MHWLPPVLEPENCLQPALEPGYFVALLGRPELLLGVLKPVAQADFEDPVDL